MTNLWEEICYFIGVHRVAAISVASVVAAGAVGTGGYFGYQHFANQEPEVEEVVAEIIEAPDVVYPEFKSISITSDSIEKDLTIYIADDQDECITGVPFEVKLISPEDALSLQNYVQAIQELNKQIVVYTGDKRLDTGEIRLENDEESEAEEEESSSSSEFARPVEVTITDEEGEVVEVVKPSAADDPLYQLFCDKEIALQSYAMAIKDIDGKVYVDEDADGIINETDMEPGNYVACLVYDDSWETLYDPSSYAADVNVKDKVEYKVVKEIAKKVVADKPAEDGQKKEATPVENVLKDTVEYVESSKTEKSSSIQSTTSVKKPEGVSASGKETFEHKPGGGNPLVSKKITSVIVSVTVKAKQTASSAVSNVGKLQVFKTADQDTQGNEREGSGESTGGSGSNQETGGNGSDTGNNSNKEPESGTKEPEGGNKDSESGNKDSGSGSGTGSGNTGDSNGSTNKEEPEKKPESETQKPEENKKYEVTIECLCDGKVIHSETKEVKKGDKIEAPSITGYKEPSPAKYDVTDESKKKYQFTYKGNPVPTEHEESAQLILPTCDKGIISIKFETKVNGKASDAVKISDVKVNGNAVTDGKYKSTGNGDYKITATVTYTDKSTDKISVVYTLSGASGNSTAQLYDTDNHELFLDEACTKKATVADYVEGKKYFYKLADYAYRGWQNINGLSYFFDKEGNKVTGTQIIQGVTYKFGSDGALIVNGNGIDVSKYQKTIDWKSAKSAVSFAIIRCGYRGMYDGQLHEDPYFYQNMSGAKAAGVATGVYIYSTALTEAEAVEEASAAVAMANRAGGCSYPIYIDMEDSVRGVNKLSNAQRNAIITAFCTTVQSGGYKAGVYANKNWMTNLINPGSLPSSCYIWVAQYNTSCSYSGKYSMWQYTSKGSVPGIVGSVDMNKSFF